MSSWTKIATQKVDKPVEKAVKKVEPVQVVKPQEYDAYSIFENKYGDKIFNNLMDIYSSDKGRNELYRNLGPSELFGFFMNYVDVEYTVEDDIEKEISATQENNESDNDDDYWY